MRIYPAIDIKNGKCVRLRQGSFADVTVYEDNPVNIARIFKEAGAEYIHVVDLDGALKGTGINSKVIADIVKETGLPVQTGGGIRTMEDISSRLEAGVERVIIGTQAVKEPEFVAAAVQKFGAEHVAVGLDGRGGLAATEGWEKESDKSILSLAQGFSVAGVRTVIYTDIARDGMLTGPDFSYTETLVRESGLEVIASGGVSGPEDLVRLSEIKVSGVIIGKAYYEGRIDLEREIKLYGKENA